MGKDVGESGRGILALVLETLLVEALLAHVRVGRPEPHIGPRQAGYILQDLGTNDR